MTLEMDSVGVTPRQPKQLLGIWRGTMLGLCMFTFLGCGPANRDEEVRTARQGKVIEVNYLPQERNSYDALFGGEGEPFYHVHILDSAGKSHLVGVQMPLAKKLRQGEIQLYEKEIRINTPPEFYGDKIGFILKQESDFVVVK